MNDFLEQVWMDNPVKHYLIVAGVILFVWLLKSSSRLTNDADGDF